MLAAPGLLAWANRGGATMGLPLHAAWWGAGALAVGLAVLVPRGRREGGGLERSLGRAALVAPWLSLVAHLFVAHWVHEAAFRFCNLAPVALGLTGAALHRNPPWLAGRRTDHLLAWTAGLCLLVVGQPAPELNADFAGLEGLVYSPLRGTLLGLSLLFLWALLAGRGRLHAAPAAALFTLACSGHSPAAILGAWRSMGAGLLPRTRSQWGAVSVVAAFLLLGAGAALSVLKRGAGESGEAGGAGGSR
jgi:hypothetical protein